MKAKSFIKGMLFVVIYVAFFVGCSKSDENLKGVWNGKCTYEIGGNPYTDTFEIMLNQKGNELTGTAIAKGIAGTKQGSIEGLVMDKTITLQAKGDWSLRIKGTVDKGVIKGECSYSYLHGPLELIKQ